MTNNYRGRVYEKLRTGTEEKGYTLGERLSKSKGASGSLVFKGEKDGKPVILKVGSYGLLDSFEGDEIEKLGDFRRREREVLQLAGNHPNIPGYVDSFTIEGNDFYPEPIHILAMEYLDLPSVGEKVARGEKVSEKETQILLRDGLSALKHLHTDLPYQVLHRDVKPGNILLNHEKAYLIDFDIVKQGDDDATSATTIDTAGYYPVDAFTGHPNPSHDLVALGHVAVAGVSGKEIRTIRSEQNLYGLDAVGVNGLQISSKYREFIGKLIAEPKTRFRTAGEALGDLERRIGKSLPVKISTSKVIDEKKMDQYVEYKTGMAGLTDGAADMATNEKNNLPEVIEEKDEVMINDENDVAYRFKKKSSIYETAKGIYDFVGEQWVRDGNGKEIVPYKDFFGYNHQFVLAYLKHEANKKLGFPQPWQIILNEVLDGKKSLEEIAKEKERGFFGYGDYIEYVRSHKRDKVAYEERRKQLLDVFGIEEGNSFFGAITGGAVGSMGIPFGVGLISSEFIQKPLWNFGEFLAYVIGGAFLGAIAGPNIQKYVANRKLLKKAREVDSWIGEARKSQGLEEKVDGVELTEREIDDINPSLTSTVAGMGTFGVVGLSLEHPWSIIPASCIGIGAVFGTYFGLKEYLTNKKLKEKRLAAGLPADGMEEISRFTFADSIDGDNVHLKNALARNGLTKKLFRKKFVEDGIEVKYYTQSNGHAKVVIRAISEKRKNAKELADALKGRYPHIITEISKSPHPIHPNKPIEVNLLPKKPFDYDH